MAKRILSMLLSLALLLSCVSGITLFTSAEPTLPTPLAQWDANSGTFVNNGFCPGWGGTPWTNPTIEAIGDTGEYGAKLTGDWQGGWFGGAMFANAKADTAYTMVIEYYIDSEWATTDRHQMFRYAMDSVTTDLFTDTDKLASKKSGLVFCHFTAEQVAAFGSNDKRFYVYGCEAGTNIVYIQSMKLIESQYVHEAGAADCTYLETAAVPVCDYYPDITAAPAYNMNTVVHPDEPNFVYVQMAGNPMAASRTENKWLYVKVYAAEGYENDTFKLATYEVSVAGGDSFWSGEQGIPSPQIPMVNGEGALFLEACFNNTLNNRSSMRLEKGDFEKLSRIEIYDIATYCDEATATEELKAKFHEAMADNLFNVVQDGYQAPSLDAPGATGSIACATCGEVLSESREIPKLSIYAQLDFSTGAFVGTAANASGYDIQPIPGTDYYGAMLNKQNQSFGFNLTDAFAITAEDIANGKTLAISYEYYVGADWQQTSRLTLLGNGYNLGINGGGSSDVWDCMPVNMGMPLVREQLGVVTFKVGPDGNYTMAHNGNIGNGTQAVAGETYGTLSQAEALVAGKNFTFICWNGSETASMDRAIYLKSVTIHDAADLYEMGSTNPGYYYVDFEGVAIDPYYPDYKVQANYGLSASTEKAEYYNQDTEQEYVRFNYMYVKMPPELLSNAETFPATPVKLVFERKEGSTVSGMQYQYQVGGPGATWSPYITVEFDENGIYETILWDAKFFNTLNGGSSIRLVEVIYEQSGDAENGYTYTEKIGDELADIAAIKVYDLRANCEEYHDIFTEANGNLVREGYVAPTYEAAGFTGDLVCAHCGEVFEAGREIPMLFDADYAQLDFSDGIVVQQSVNTFTAHGGASIVPVEIPGTDGAYGIRIDAHNSGFMFSLGEFGGYTVDDLDNGLELAISVEYYLPEGFANDGRLCFDAGLGSDKYLALYTSYSGRTWDCAVVNPATNFAKQQLNVATFKVGKDVTYVTGPGQFGAANQFDAPVEVNTYDFAKALLNGDTVTFRLWKNKDVPLYIKSITIYDAKDLAEREETEGNLDFVDFEVEFAESPVYYPQYAIKGYADGLTAGDVVEIENDDGTYVAYTYIAVTRALNTTGEPWPVLVRFTFKDDCEITTFDWSYQGTHYNGSNGGEIWSHLTTEVTGKVVEVLLEDAVLENQLNGKGSLRLPNGTANTLATDSVAKIEVLAVVDKSELEAAILNAAEAGLYKTPATVAVLEEALAAAAEVMADTWATEEDVANAVAAIEEAIAGLEDCLHENGTETVGYVEETCTTDGYTGDTACVDCGFVAEGNEGTVIPKHETRLINVKEDSCKEPGYSGDLWCDQCQKVVKEGIYGTALPHTWNEGEITKPATPNERGEITKTCTVCGETTKTYFDYEFTGEFGDVNADNKIDSTDARLVLQYAVGKIQADAITIELADVNGDNKTDSTDARLILQYAVGKIQSFPNA